MYGNHGLRVGPPKPFLDVLVEDSGYTIYLSNSGKDVKKHPIDNRQHLVDWVGQFVPRGYTQEECSDWIPMHSWAIERLIQWGREERRLDIVDDFMDEILTMTAGRVPDSSSLQLAHEGKVENVTTPGELVQEIEEVIEKHLPKGEFEGTPAPEARFKKKDIEAIVVNTPVRIAAALICASMACEEANRGDEWYIKAKRIRHKSGRFKGKLREPRIGGCRMAYGVYLYRRFTNTRIKQIATMLRIPQWE